MERLFKYVGYAAVSIVLSWLSSIGEVDYIGSLSNSVVQLLITLLTLYTTISSILINRLLEYEKVTSNEANLKPVVDEMKRNVRIESCLILFTLIIIIFSNVVLKQGWLCDAFVNVARNSVVIFTLMYFVIVVYDSSMGLYDLLQGTKERE